MRERQRRHKIKGEASKRQAKEKAKKGRGSCSVQDSLEIVMAWKTRRRCWILRLMAAAIMRRVVASRANKNKVVKATDTMSATAGKTHSAHLQRTPAVASQT